jgi:hypothetical protein
VLVAPVTAQPQVAQPRHRILRQRRRDVGLIVLLWKSHEIFQFPWIEAGEFKIEIGRGEFP